MVWAGGCPGGQRRRRRAGHGCQRGLQHRAAPPRLRAGHRRRCWDTDAGNTTAGGPGLPRRHAAAPRSLLLCLPQANEGPQPLLSSPDSGGGTAAQHNPNLPPQPDTAREQRGRGRARHEGTQRCREGEREEKGRARGTGRQWTPPAAGKGLGPPPAAKRRALTGRYRQAAHLPELAIVARRKRRCSPGAPDTREASGSAGPPSAAGGAGRGRAGRGGGAGPAGLESAPGRARACCVSSFVKASVNVASPPPWAGRCRV